MRNSPSRTAACFAVLGDEKRRRARGYNADVMAHSRFSLLGPLRGVSRGVHSLRDEPLPAGNGFAVVRGYPAVKAVSPLFVLELSS